MRFYKISLRYLLPQYGFNLVNILSIITFVGILTSTGVLFVILSAFNGLDKLIRSGYQKMQPELVVYSKEHKLFKLKQQQQNELSKLNNRVSYYTILEGNILVSHNGLHTVATVKGLPKGYNEAINLNELLIDGSSLLKDSSTGLDFAIVGAGLADYLNVSLSNPEYLYLRIPETRTSMNILFRGITPFHKKIKPGGIFSSNQEMDSGYLLTNLEVVKELFKTSAISSVELFLANPSEISFIKEKLQEIFPPPFVMKTRDEQNASLYKLLNTEKFMVYLILTFVLFIAICNMAGSISMLIVSKRKDIALLNALGFSLSNIRSIFFTLGVILVSFSAAVGLSLGVLICLAQKYSGLIKLGSQVSFLAEPYPVDLRISDALVIFLTTMLLSLPILSLSILMGTKNLNTPQALKGGL